MTIWLDGIPGGYHDTRCPCDGHCRNCFEDLAAIRDLRAQLIAEGNPAVLEPLHPLARYCSPHCRNHAKRERALDRALAAVTTTSR